MRHAAPAFERLRGARILLTGGTRFFGSWLLESLLRADQDLRLGAEAWVLARDPAAFRRRFPRLAGRRELHVFPGDTRSFVFPRGRFTHVIHGASGLNVPAPGEDPLEIGIEGTRRALEFARARGAKAFLLLSSGAVYGRQPTALRRVREDYPGAPDPLDPGSSYAQAKRMAEHLCARYRERYGLAVKIARAFSFAGPFLPLDRHNALGNFVRDALAGGPIRVLGDGTPTRSYLYGSDLTVWLWTILTEGTSGRAYNVGSEEAVTVRELARRAAEVFGVKAVFARTSGRGEDRYVPSTRRARSELGLRQRVGLDDALRRMGIWHRAQETGGRP